MVENHDNDGALDGPGSGSQGGVGATLLAARERQGMTREDVAAQTRIAERHLVAIEEDRFGDLAGKTYAVGFSRAYAKVVGLDEGEIADRVRDQISPQDYEPRHVANFEPGDPARVPPSALAWIAGLAAIGVIVVLFFVWDSLFSPEADMPSLIADKPAAITPAPRRVAPASVSAPRGGVVTMKAMAPNVWVKVTNAAGEQLFQKELSQGEVYTVPSDASGPVLRTGRPDALELSIDGRALPRLEDRPVIVSNVPLGADQLRARLGGQGATSAPAATATPSRTPPSSPVASRAPAPQPVAEASASSARVAAEAAAPRPVSTDSE